MPFQAFGAGTVVGLYIDQWSKIPRYRSPKRQVAQCIQQSFPSFAERQFLPYSFPAKTS